MIVSPGSIEHPFSQLKEIRVMQSARHMPKKSTFLPFKKRVTKYAIGICSMLFSITATANNVNPKFTVSEYPNIPLSYQAITEDYMKFVRHEFIHERLPGLAVAIVRPDGIVQLQTFGKTQLKNGKSINENTVFRIASVSKTFAAELTGLLVEEGKLDWDDKISDYSKNFRLANNQQRQISLKHILSHSTGLVPYAFDNVLDANRPLSKIFPKFRKLKLLCRPSRCYGYQNIAFSLIEDAIEASSNQSYSELMQQRIFTPLQMQTASVGYKAFNASENHAMPHVTINKQRFRTIRVKENYYQIAPAAGVNASITDLSKWLMAQMGSHPDIISKNLVETVTTPQIRTQQPLRMQNWRKHLSDAYYGLGWRIYQYDDETVFYHGGLVEGFRASIAYSKRYQIGIAILMNADSNVIGHLSAAFWSNFFAQTKNDVYAQQGSTQYLK